MQAEPLGTILAGEEAAVRAASERFAALPVDMETPEEPPEDTGAETTLAAPVTVRGPGTFSGKTQRTLTLAPTERRGWWFDRADLADAMPIAASICNVWTTGRVVRNIVLCCGSPHNYVRMAEHIVALKTGLNLDHALVRVASGDPPLFDRGAAELADAVLAAGIRRLSARPRYVTVKEAVTLGSDDGRFLTFLPAEPGSRRLLVDCAVDFRSAIGRQRVRFTVGRRVFARAAEARTNTTVGTMLYTKTVGRLFADIRRLGYTTRNIQIAGRRRYFNEPRLVHEGKSLEAVWHRAALDLLAAVSLIDSGRFCGTVVSYKSGHALDVRMVRELYRRELLAEV